jgi:tRNA-dihydrouridine synthase
MSKVPANWDYISRVVKLRNELAPNTVIIGNGDVIDIKDGEDKSNKSGCDGIMIGRACFGNPWVFSSQKITKTPQASPTSVLLRKTEVGVTDDDYSTPERYWLHNKPDVSLETKLRVMVEHSELFCELLPHKNFATMKKHYKAYCHGFAGAKELRMQLMDAPDVATVATIVDSFLKN